MSSYEKPLITDIGSLQELTAAKPKFGPVIPAYGSQSKGGWHHGTSSRGTTGFSGAQTTT
jgi:hypothetical protein